MPIRTNKTRELYIAYVLDEEILQQLQSLLNNEVSHEVDWFISLTDGSSLYTTDLAEVFAIPNTPARAIRRIRCNAASSTPDRKEVDVTFRNFGATIGTGSIIYEITGDDKSVVYLSDKLEDFLLSQRQWYTVLRRTVSSWLLQSLFMFLVTLIVSNKLSAVSKHMPISLFITLGIVAEGILVVLLDYLIKYLCPVSCFVLGKGKQRYQSLVQMRAVAGVGVILAVVVGVFVNWISG